MNEPLSTEQREAIDKDRNCMSKLTWATEEQARAAASYAKWQYGGDDSKPRPYRCRHCLKWHLSRDYRDAD